MAFRSTLNSTQYPTTPLTTAINITYESLLGFGRIFGFDVFWIVLIGLGAAICCIGYGLCYYMISRHENGKELEKTVEAINDTIELKDFGSNTSGITTNPVSSMIVHQNARLEQPKVPRYYGAAANNQRLQQKHQQHQSRPVAMDRFYAQSSVESNASTQNSANLQSNGSQKSIQSQSSNVNLFQNYGPQSYPQHMNNNNYQISQQMQNNNSNMNYNHTTYHNQYIQQNGVQQHSQKHIGNIPNVHVHSQQQRNNPNHTHHQQIQQRQPQSHAPSYPAQPQSYPQQNRVIANQPIEIIKPGRKPTESVVSDATTATTNDCEDSRDTSDFSSSADTSDHGNTEPPTPSVNCAKQPGHLQSPAFMITVTDQSNYQDSPMSDDIVMNPCLDDILIVNNNDSGDMLENMAELLEFQDINCANDTPLSTQTMVLHDTISRSPSIDNENSNKFPMTRGRLVVLNED